MVLIQLELSDEIDKAIKVYMAKNNCNKKSVAITQLLKQRLKLK